MKNTLQPIIGLLNNFAVEVCIKADNGIYIVNLICDDGVVIKQQHKDLYISLLQAAHRFIELQGEPEEVLQEYKQALK